MIRDTAVLKAKVSESKSRTSANTIRNKSFPGGHLALIGANSPSGLASRPIRIVLADEVDRYNASAGDEGNPLTLAGARQRGFWNKKTVLCSTPGRKADSIIWDMYLQSDQRKYMVPCPDCHTEQLLSFKPGVGPGVQWDSDKNQHKPETAHYVCEYCGALWDDTVKNAAVKRGRWLATADPKEPGIVGFHIHGLMSPFPGASMRSIVTQFLYAKDRPEKLQVWVNTVLGEPWEEPFESVEGATLLERGENYTTFTLPWGIQFITAGVDVQGDRLEVQVIGWGFQEEAWVIDYEIIRGDPADKQVWEDLDIVLQRTYRVDSSGDKHIRATCIDTGYLGQRVHEFCKKRGHRRVFPIKGIDGNRPVWPLRSIRTHDNNQVFMVGVDTAKDLIYGAASHYKLWAWIYSFSGQ